MTALERIKEIQLRWYKAEWYTVAPLNAREDIDDLLRAFQAMRNIAWEPGNKSTEEIDAMFEERMKDKN